MKKSTWILLVIFALLGSITAWVVMSKDDQRSTLVDNWDGNFKVEDVSQIYKIFLADRKGNTTTLDRKADHWIYNGKYKVHPNKIQNLLDAIHQVEIRHIPPAAATDPIVKDLATNGIKVQIFDQAGREIKCYYVGGTTPDALGTFMIMEGSEKPYVTQIPSVEGSLNVRYMIQGDDWRDKTLFDLKAETIQFVSIEYPKQRNKSFRLEKKEGIYSIEPFFETTSQINQTLEEGRALAYLDKFSDIYMAAYENDNPFREEFETSRIPFAKITLRYGETDKTVILHPAKSSNEDNPLRPVEYYLAEVEPEGDFVSVAHENIKKILWAYDFFFE